MSATTSFPLYSKFGFEQVFTVRETVEAHCRVVKKMVTKLAMRFTEVFLVHSGAEVGLFFFYVWRSTGLSIYPLFQSSIDKSFSSEGFVANSTPSLSFPLLPELRSHRVFCDFTFLRVFVFTFVLILWPTRRPGPVRRMSPLF